MPLRAIAVSALLLLLATPARLDAAYTSTISGSTATMVGDASSDHLLITQSGGLFFHNRETDPGFEGPHDFDSSMPGIQTLSSATGIININAGDGNDAIALADGVNLRGAVDGGIGIDTLDYALFTTPVTANLGLNVTGLSATLGGDQENPETTHVGTGTAQVSNYNIATHTFDIVITVTDLPPGDVIGFHIHQEKVGTNGPIIVNFPSGGDPALVPSGTGFIFTATGLVLPAPSEAAFLGGGTYVNIHTATFPGGAIRGQLFSAGNAPLASGAATSTTGIANIESLRGGSAGDSLVGNSDANTLIGGAGADWIVAGPGVDSLLGDAGADILVWSNGDGFDVDEGGADGDVVYVNGNITGVDAFAVSANAASPARLRLARTNVGIFALDIDTTETLIVNGVGGNDTFTVNDLTGVAAITTVSLNGFADADTFTVRPYTAGVVSVRGGTGSDTLNYDAQSRAVSGDTTPPDGSITSGGNPPVSFIQTETVAIVNPQPSIIITDATAGEPGSAVFNVTLSNPSVLTVTVNFATANGTAIAPGDYTAQSGMVTFVPSDVAETITVPVIGDGLAEPAETFFVNLTGAVNAAVPDAQGQGTITNNAAPTISAIPNQTIPVNGTTGPVPFTVNDAESGPGPLTLSGSSTNMSLVPNGNISFGGSGANRTVTVTPAANQTGQTTVTVNVSDGLSTTPTMFTVTVDSPPPPPPEPPPPAPPQPPPPPPNQPPTIGGLANATIEENASATFVLTLGDDATPASALTIDVSASNAALVPATGVVLTGSGASRTLTVSPVLEGIGQTTLTAFVSDGALTTTATAVLTVTPVTAATPLLPPSGLTATVNGGTIQLSWTGPAAGGRPSFFIIEGGTAAGTSTLPLVNVPGTQMSWTLTLPPGVYFFRVRSGNRAGTSAVSNEVSVLVTTAGHVPGAPVGVVATVIGQQVTLAWRPPVTGGEATEWLIELDTTPGPGDVRPFRVPASVFSVSGALPRGEYVARVRGLNAAGQGPPSNEPRFSVDEPGGGGCDVPVPDAPDAPVLLPPTIVGRTVTLGWRPPRTGRPVSYRLIVGSLPGGSDLLVVNVGTVNAFVVTANPGTYHVSVAAINTCGPGAESNSIAVVVTGEGPPPPPGNLRAQVTGSTVTLAWDASPGAVSYLIEAGTSPGATNAAVHPLVETTITVSGIPSGVYYVRVRGIGAGGASLTSAEIVLLVP